MIWHFSVSRIWEFLEKRYIYATNFDFTHLLNSIQTKQSWQTMYSWKSPVDERSRRSLSRNEDAAAQIPATDGGRGSRETQNHGRCWVKHHPGHSSDLSLATFRPVFETILYTLLFKSQTCSIKQGQDARETQYQGTGGSDHFNDSIISSWPTFSHRGYASIWKLSKVCLSNSFMSSRRPIGKKSI